MIQTQIKQFFRRFLLWVLELVILQQVLIVLLEERGGVLV